MKPRKLLIAANWKMNPMPAAAESRTGPYQSHAAVDVVVFPTFLDLERCVKAGLVVGAQCGHAESIGAHTGDVSMAMLKAAGCRYVLCGHSERRRDHHESDDFVAQQAIEALELGLHPVVCIGETLEQRERGKEKDVIRKQLKDILLLLPSNETSERAGLGYPLPGHPARGGLHIGKGEPMRGKPSGFPLTIAYEPVWAIGTGKTATAAQAQEMHAFIRSLLPKTVQGDTRILYGGSVKADNAYDLLYQSDIDGALVGGASLKPDEFGKIVEAALELAK